MLAKPGCLNMEPGALPGPGAESGFPNKQTTKTKTTKAFLRRLTKANTTAQPDQGHLRWSTGTKL